MKFYGKAEQAANSIIEAFRHPEGLPKALATIFVHRQDDIPCRKWSWANQLIVALAGHHDARGFRQWQAVGRNVRKSQKSFSILSPCVKTWIDDQDEKYTCVIGFRSTAVFGLNQTEGNPVDTKSHDWIESLPLLEVAQDWGISVTTFPGKEYQSRGFYQSDGVIALGVENVSTWLHELIHAADHRVRGNIKGGVHLDQEVVAQLGSAVLATILELDHDTDLGKTWTSISNHSAKAKVEMIAVCQQLLKRTCDAVAQILDTAETLTEVAK